MSDLHEAAEELDAATLLAAHFGWDVEWLQFHRDRLFWGNSTMRWADLPVAELALERAKERK